MKQRVYSLAEYGPASGDLEQVMQVNLPKDHSGLVVLAKGDDITLHPAASTNGSALIFSVKINGRFHCIDVDIGPNQDGEPISLSVKHIEDLIRNDSDDDVEIMDFALCENDIMEDYSTDFSIGLNQDGNFEIYDPEYDAPVPPRLIEHPERVDWKKLHSSWLVASLGNDVEENSLLDTRFFRKIGARSEEPGFISKKLDKELQDKIQKSHNKEKFRRELENNFLDIADSTEVQIQKEEQNAQEKLAKKEELDKLKKDAQTQDHKSDKAFIKTYSAYSALIIGFAVATSMLSGYGAPVLLATMVIGFAAKRYAVDHFRKEEDAANNARDDNLRQYTGEVEKERKQQESEQLEKFKKEQKSEENKKDFQDMIAAGEGIDPETLKMLKSSNNKPKSSFDSSSLSSNKTANFQPNDPASIIARGETRGERDSGRSMGG